jgi:hypothetical protein
VVDAAVPVDGRRTTDYTRQRETALRSCFHRCDGQHGCNTGYG